MSNQEQLHFRIGLSATVWDKKPQWRILLNNTEVASGTSDSSLEYTEFDYEVTEGVQRLVIQLLNKDNSDTVENADKTAIVKDMLLHIKSIEIDEIDLGSLPWSKGTFVAQDPARPTLANCVDLGWNGDWCLEFDSPFYIWLLESL
jgi:hypothetical protein